jgi:hypothetical protein
MRTLLSYLEVTQAISDNSKLAFRRACRRRGTCSRSPRSENSQLSTSVDSGYKLRRLTSFVQYFGDSTV